jgi:GNAT superfamily N-acetyltransferase
MFKGHHYLSSDLNKASRCYIGLWNNRIVAFGASLALPNGNMKNAWRGHRICILPDFQGMGIGPRFSDAIAQIHINQGYRFFSRTAHPRLINYRENSPLWKPTSKHKKVRTDIKHEKVFNNHYTDNKRLCGSFEFIGTKEI